LTGDTRKNINPAAKPPAGTNIAYPRASAIKNVPSVPAPSKGAYGFGMPDGKGGQYVQDGYDHNNRTVIYKQPGSKTWTVGLRGSPQHRIGEGFSSKADAVNFSTYVIASSPGALDDVRNNNDPHGNRTRELNKTELEAHGYIRGLPGVNS
jgi:hypothetical protein